MLAALEALAREPDLSNRAVAERAGIRDPGHASRLLGRLSSLGLVENGRPNAGVSNAWRLTQSGRDANATALSSRPSDRA